MIPDMGLPEKTCYVPQSILQRFLGTQGAGRQGMAHLRVAYQLKPERAIITSMQHCAVYPRDLLVIAAFSGDCTASRLELAHPKASHRPLPLPTCSVSLAASSTRSFPAKQRWNFAEHQLSTNLSSPNTPWLLATTFSSNVTSYGTLSSAWGIPTALSAVMSFLQGNPYFMLARTMINPAAKPLCSTSLRKKLCQNCHIKKENTMQDHWFHHPE